MTKAGRPKRVPGAPRLIRIDIQMTEEMKQRAIAMANENQRSLSSEIVFHLKRALEAAEHAAQ